jgi:hypothetical protein
LAVHLRLATSLPVSGSEIARHILFSPDRTKGTTLSYNSFDPNLTIGGRPITSPVPSPIVN